ncbi:hypothetical protein QE152_g35238 [Popillia japonica]|uniref:Uncharacterized protein n=1 Tax=Popillia japonica TaxID=7064 RepID=A0AAW1IFW0_POPJA
MQEDMQRNQQQASLAKGSLAFIADTVGLSLENSKQRTCDKLNENRNDIQDIETGQSIYVRKKLRNKLKPKFSKEKVIKINDKTIETQKQTKLSKDVIKKKRKFTKDPMLQNEADSADHIDPSNPNDNRNARLVQGHHDFVYKIQGQNLFEHVHTLLEQVNLVNATFIKKTKPNVKVGYDHINNIRVHVNFTRSLDESQSRSMYSLITLAARSVKQTELKLKSIFPEFIRNKRSPFNAETKARIFPEVKIPSRSGGVI